MDKVFLCYQNADLCESRGPMILQYVVDSEATAATWKNAEPGFRSVTAMPVIKGSELDEHINKAEINKALAKLSPYERRILGLN